MAGTSRKDKAIVRRRQREILSQSKSLEVSLRKIYSKWHAEIEKSIKGKRKRIEKIDFSNFFLGSTRGLFSFNPIGKAILKQIKAKSRKVYALNLTPEFPTAITLSSAKGDALAAKFVKQFGVKLAGFADIDNQRVTRILSTAVQKGWDLDRIFKELDNLFDGLTKKRVKRVAEQTAGTAQSVAQVQFWEEAAPEAAKEFQKIWLPSIGGANDRTNHNAIKSVMFGKKFSVPAVRINSKLVRGSRAAKMDHPRDPSAPLDQILSCK